MSIAALLALMGATFVSEDLTLIGAAALVRHGDVPLLLVIGACALGIFLGDVALMGTGRLLSRYPGQLARLGRYGRVHRAIVSTRALIDGVDRHPLWAMLASRALPGTRLPLYLAAGAHSRRPWAVVCGMALATAVWTPSVIMLLWSIDEAASAVALHAALGMPIMLASALLLMRAGRRASTARPDAVAATLERLTRWEFWPSWAIYLPVIPWIVLLAIRHRSVTLFTAANPGLPDGGFVGESKSDILDRLPARWTLAHVVVEPDLPSSRAAAAVASLRRRGLALPLVAKPDVGQRGVGVRWVQTVTDLERYLADVPGRVVLQQGHPGPFEAGLFYVRWPGDERGRIMSLTDKHFPIVEGDGASTLRTLILTHPRYRLQSRTFLARHATRLEEVPPAGNLVVLARTGNHAQGTEFRDGRQLITPALAARLDAIAREIEGFYFGRFDVRYRDPRAFVAGDDLAIVELNGVTSEATHIYDPDASIVSAWRTLCAQWTLAFAIGAANRARGHRPMGLGRAVRLVVDHLRSSPALPMAD